ncbi:tetratricopeptide repeat protein [Desulfospira joergensenii]|uniref:tetratricopeptide repeat protein n=1 Tax=Desulfospira joergensenii TaxID=53329 RepID=UPI001FC9E0D8|nr:tetratricopeptide repeat protein [Desulfospira joergensenii]
MGCDPIIFIGQDLAFSNRKGHSNNVVLSSNEKVKNQLETGQDIFWVKGNVEAKVPTSRQMNGYQRTFEKMIQESENCVINATEGGVFIEGAEHMPLVKAIDKYCKEEFSVKIEDLMNPPVLTAALESVLVEINKAERVVQKAEKISGPVQKKLMQMEKKGTKVSSFSEFPEAFRVKVSDLDRCHKRADNMQLFSLFDEITLEGLRQNEREKKAVDALEGDPEKYFEWFSRSVLRVDKINKIRMENLAWLKEKINETVRYHKAENQFMERLDADSPDKQIFLKLAELYLQAGNIILLETLLDQSRTAFCETVDYHYYLGLINLYRDNYAAAWEKRLEILQSDKKYADQLHGKMHEVSTFYLKQAMSILKRTGKSKDRNYIGEMLLFDAIKSCPDNDEAAEEVRRIAKSDFERVQLVFQKANGEIDSPERKIIKNWTIRMPEDPVLAGVLGENTVCGFHLLYGKVLAIQGDYQNALENYQAACSVRPNAPDIHIAMADLCFEAKNFESGLAFLKKAVELDRNYAVYWCNIGNNLKAAEDYRGAIAAYEQYFMALPEKIEVLKDIGDCYMKLGELEAAHESFRQYKYLLNKG